LFCLTVIGLAVLTSTEGPGIAAGSAKGSPLGGLEDAIVFHARIFHFDSTFQKDLAKAAALERAELKPGQSQLYWIYVEYKQGRTEWPVFAFLQKKGQQVIHDAKNKRHGLILIRRQTQWLTTPAVPVTRKEFNAIQAKGPLPAKHLEYEDYVFAVDAGNRMSGFRQGIDLAKAENGTIRFSGSLLIDLTDAAVYSPASARVILSSKADSDTYVVFDPDTQKRTTHRKQAGLKDSGNTVFLLVSWQKREYTIVFRHLNSFSVQAGDTLTPCQKLGSFRPAAATTDKRPATEIWRVPTPADRWLARRSGPNAPYSVWSR
jgi:hypothetical protein